MLANDERHFQSLAMEMEATLISEDIESMQVNDDGYRTNLTPKQICTKHKKIQSSLKSRNSTKDGRRWEHKLFRSTNPPVMDNTNEFINATMEDM